MAEENARVDTTFIGYLLIGAILLMFAVLGFQDGGLFGEANFEDGRFVSSTLPLDYTMASTLCAIIGGALVILSIYAYRTGKRSTAAIFSAFSIGLITYALVSVGRILKLLGGEIKFIEEYLFSTSWFIFIAIAVFIIMLALYQFLDKTSILATILTALAALMFLFIGFAYLFAGTNGIDDGVTKAMGIVFGVFAFLGFLLATYLSLACSLTKSKLPVI